MVAATCKSTVAPAIERSLATTPATVQRALIPGKLAGPYREPDHASGEAAWPGRQVPTRQLSLFATFVKTPDRPRRADPTPSPTQERTTTTTTTQTRLTTFVGFPPSSPSPSDAELSSEDDTND